MYVPVVGAWIKPWIRRLKLLPCPPGLRLVWSITVTGPTLIGVPWKLFVGYVVINRSPVACALAVPGIDRTDSARRVTQSMTRAMISTAVLLLRVDMGSLVTNVFEPEV